MSKELIAYALKAYEHRRSQGLMKGIFPASKKIGIWSQGKVPTTPIIGDVKTLNELPPTGLTVADTFKYQFEFRNTCQIYTIFTTNKDK